MFSESSSVPVWCANCTRARSQSVLAWISWTVHSLANSWKKETQNVSDALFVGRQRDLIGLLSRIKEILGSFDSLGRCVQVVVARPDLQGDILHQLLHLSLGRLGVDLRLENLIVIGETRKNGEIEERLTLQRCLMVWDDCCNRCVRYSRWRQESEGRSTGPSGCGLPP